MKTDQQSTNDNSSKRNHELMSWFMRNQRTTQFLSVLCGMNATVVIMDLLCNCFPNNQINYSI